MMPDYENIKISELKPYKRNARTHSDEQIEVIANSIREFGFRNPVIIDENNMILAGHGRVKAAQRLGLLTVPFVRWDDMTDEQKRGFILADNKTADLAGWDFDILQDELQRIDLDMSEFGFDDIEIEIEDGGGITEDDIPEPPKEPKAKPGDLYQLGKHRLLCGDSTDEETLKKLMDGANADLVFTDPPYNVAFNGRSGNFEVIKNDKLSKDEHEKFINATIKAIKYINAPNQYIWCNWQFYGILQEKLDYKACIVWAKNVFGLGNGYRHQYEFCLFNGTLDKEITNESDLWQISKDTNYVHPTQKPVALAARALKNHKTAKIVVDLFGGSGSTLIACEQLNRKCYMMELDPCYVDVIIERWETLTGKKAVKL